MSRTFRVVSHKVKEYHKTKIVRDGTPTRKAHSCTNHGGCPWCLGNRMHKHVKQYAKVRDQLKEKGL